MAAVARLRGLNALTFDAYSLEMLEADLEMIAGLQDSISKALYMMPRSDPSRLKMRRANIMAKELVSLLRDLREHKLAERVPS